MAKLISFLCAIVSMAHSSTSSPILGIHPLEEKLFASELIKCKDGSAYFTPNRINDQFCDCLDGTDEPGTSACPAGKFYCRNVGSTPQFLFSSRVNDGYCDCCDGSDEYDGTSICPNTCVMGGIVMYKTENSISTIRDLGSIDAKDKNPLTLDELFQKLKGLKVVIVLQVLLIGCLCALWLCHRRVRSRRRRPHQRNPPLGR